MKPHPSEIQVPSVATIRASQCYFLCCYDSRRDVNSWREDRLILSHCLGSSQCVSADGRSPGQLLLVVAATRGCLLHHYWSENNLRQTVTLKPVISDLVATRPHLWQVLETFKRTTNGTPRVQIHQSRGASHIQTGPTPQCLLGVPLESSFSEIHCPEKNQSNDDSETDTEVLQFEYSDTCIHVRVVGQPRATSYMDLVFSIMLQLDIWVIPNLCCKILPRQLA